MLYIVQQNKFFKKDVAWCLSNITAGKYEHIIDVINSPIFDKVLEFLRDIDFKVKREALWIVSNCSSCGCQDVTKTLVSVGLLDYFCETLSENSNSEILSVCLETLKNIFSVGDSLSDSQNINPYISEFEKLNGYAILENLTMNNDKDVSGLSKRILNSYWNNNIN